MGSIYSGPKIGSDGAAGQPSLSPRIVQTVEVPQVVEKPVYHLVDLPSEPVHKPAFHVVELPSEAVERPAFHVETKESEAVVRPSFQVVLGQPQPVEKPHFNVVEHAFPVHKPKYDVQEKLEVIEKPVFEVKDRPTHLAQVDARLMYLMLILQLITIALWGAK